MTTVRPVELTSRDTLRERLLVTPEEAAERLSLSRRTVYELMSRRLLGSVKIGRSRRIPRRALEEYAAKLMDSMDSPTVPPGWIT